MELSAFNRHDYAMRLSVFAVVMMFGQASAGTWIVTNAVELKQALVIAETNLQTDTIFMETGVYEVDDLAGQLLTYEPNGTDPNAEDYALVIEATNGLAIIDGNASKQGMRLSAMGVDMANAHLSVKGLRFRECRISDSIYAGAGLYARAQRANVTIEDCEFQYCIASHIYDDVNGGGCYARAGSPGVARIRNCRFLDNRANLLGGGLYMVGNANARIDNCTFIRNESNHQGGGIYINAGLSTIINNCTFYNNSAEDFGGGIYLRLWGDSYEAWIQNTIRWTNISVFAASADIYLDDDGEGNGTGAVVVVEYSDYLDMGAAVGDNIVSNCNIHADPMLADTNDSSCTLLVASPCIDAGTNISEIVYDVDHVPRPLDGDTNGVPLCDIGAHEFAHPFGDTDGDGMYDGWEVAGSLDPTDATGINGPGGDPDSDGATNWSEFVADTDPNASTSLLKIISVSVHTNLSISWSGGQSVTQYLDCATHLAAEPIEWSAIFTNQPPTAPTPVYVQTNLSSGPLFYRVRARR